MTHITTVIFDMYDTLVQNPSDRWIEGFEAIIREQSLDTSPDRLLQEWSVGNADFRESRDDPNGPFRTYYQAWRDCFDGAFTRLGLPGDAAGASRSFMGFLSRRDPFPETVEAIGTVQNGWRTALLSNADDDYLLPNLGLLGLEFEAVLSSEEARVYKPNPGLFHQMLKRLNVAPGQAVYVGDRQYEDVQGARGVGINAVWINRSGEPLDPRLPEPVCQINSLLELPGLLAAWPPA